MERMQFGLHTLLGQGGRNGARQVLGGGGVGVGRRSEWREMITHHSSDKGGRGDGGGGSRRRQTAPVDRIPKAAALHVSR